MLAKSISSTFCLVLAVRLWFMYKCGVYLSEGTNVLALGEIDTSDTWDCLNKI